LQAGPGLGEVTKCRGGTYEEQSCGKKGQKGGRAGD
jgi:hypothetical protein